MLLLGIIPIIEERFPESYDLFEGLPVIHMADMGEANSTQQFKDAIVNYIESDKFQESNFEAGWERLFLKHRRRQLLRDAGREKEIVVDDQGKEYYQAYLYSSDEKDIFCRDNGSCESSKDKNAMDWFSSPKPKMTLKEKEKVIKEKDWLMKWEHKGQRPAIW
eukprot:Sro1805_g298830.2  (163) ;mRNA; r:16189-16677